MNVVGSSPPTLEAEDKVAGRTRYLPDQVVPGMAHAKALRSPYAHARLVSIDASQARALPGVVCVLTRDEVLADPRVENLYGYVFRDAPLVALDRVRYQGDIVAVVVAEDAHTAEEALELIDVEYEELPRLLDAEDAMAPGAPLIHERMYPIASELHPIEGTNVCHRSTLETGDVERGFAEADAVFEDVYEAPPVQHCALELHAVIADLRDDATTVWTNCQAPFPLKAELERIFKRPARVIVSYVGGGFGSKSRDRIEAVVAAASNLAKRPVRLVLTQEETFLAGYIRPAFKCWIKTGVTRDGVITARSYRFITDVGAYAITGARSANNTVKVSTGPYRIPNAFVECFAVYTNKPPSAPYRGLPTTQHTMAYETQMDRIADELSIDRVEIRKRNLLRDGDVHVTGDLIRSSHVDECLDGAVEALSGAAPASDAGVLRGRGFGCTIKYTLTPPQPSVESEAAVELGADGRFEVRVATVNIGQGSDTTMAQIAAEALGVGLESMRVVHSDTALVPPDSSTTASRSTYHMGNAVLDAASRLRAEILEVAAGLLEEEPDALRLDGGGVGVASAPERRVALDELVAANGAPLVQYGQCEVGGEYVDEQGTRYPVASTFWTFAAAGAEVEVSRETGQITLSKVSCAVNVGKAVNPVSVHKQIEGGLGMELGPTLFERLVWDDDGQLLTSSLLDYPLPTMSTMPGYETVLVEPGFPGGPYGAKGMGEVGSVVLPAAVLNAVYDATGVRFHSVPLHPEAVLRALEEAGEAASG